MKVAGVRELKAHLSAFLREVAAGETLLVTDRGRVVAEMRPPGAVDRVAAPALARYAKLVDAGTIVPAVAADDRSWSDWHGVGAPRGTARSVLDAEREEREE
jgi:antitoxin (DNA-binding transcriptional repressor) of toxin-antitoxin stability system